MITEGDLIPFRELDAHGVEPRLYIPPLTSTLLEGLSLGRGACSNEMPQEAPPWRDAAGRARVGATGSAFCAYFAEGSVERSGAARVTSTSRGHAAGCVNVELQPTSTPGRQGMGEASTLELTSAEEVSVSVVEDYGVVEDADARRCQRRSARTTSSRSSRATSDDGLDV